MPHVGDDPILHPALPVLAVDTTGCGDVFHGAYAACLSWGGDVRAAVEVATVAAGVKAGRPGGWAGIPTRAGVDECLRNPRGTRLARPMG